MIRLIDSASSSQWEAVCPANALGCRIQSAAQLCFSFPFADFWLQTGTDEKLLAVLCKVEAAWTIALCVPELPKEAEEELSAFLRAVGGQTALCPRNLAESLPFSLVRQGEILELNREHPTVSAQQTQGYPRLKEVHSLLWSCRGKTFLVPPLDPFLLDFSHRLRHGGAELAWIEWDRRLIACAMTVAQTSTCAVLGGVAVHSGYRRQGLGSQVVMQLLSKLPQPKITLLRAENENQAFYEALGFMPQGQWAELTF